MTLAAGQMDALAAIRAANKLVKAVRNGLKGSGLYARQRNTALVISNPENLDRGSVHVILATGEASHKRVVWDYLGHLPGYGSSDPDAPGVDTDAIIALLTRPDAGPEGDAG